jgi:hypothetical protein
MLHSTNVKIIGSLLICFTSSYLSGDNIVEIETMQIERRRPRKAAELKAAGLKTFYKYCKN